MAPVIIVGFLFYAATGFFLQDRFITAKMAAALQKSFQGTGLHISIGRAHWAGINRIQASRVVFRDAFDNSIPIRSEKLYLNLDLFAFLANRLHPESALREVELIKPHFELRRYSDGTINYGRYMLPGEIQMQVTFKVRKGTIRVIDYQYGRHILQKIDGSVNLNKYNVLTWDFKGLSDINEQMEWSSRGKCFFNKPDGMGQLVASHVAVDHIAPFIPEAGRYKIHSGFANIRLQFAWNKEGFWLRKGAASFVNVGFVLPWVRGPFTVAQLDAEFSPAECNIHKADIFHNRTVIRVSGLINNRSNSMKAELSADRINLADFDRLLPMVKQNAIRGEADLRLAVAGRLDHPVMNGELFINNGQFVLAGQGNITRITGRILIRDNNLKIQRLEGNYDNSLFGLSGNIENLFDPYLDLHFYGSGLNFEPDESQLSSQYGFKIDGPIDFNGTISGKPNSPKIAGEFSVGKLLYQGISFDNLRFELEWDGKADNLEVIKAQSDLWDGHLSLKGKIGVRSKRIQWQISGRLADLNINKTTFGTDGDLRGKISSDLILKGDWHKGTPFKYGSILGTFMGDDFTYHNVKVDEVNGAFNWIDGNLNIDSIQAKIGRGMIYGHLSWNPAEISANVSAENIHIRKLFPDNSSYPLDGVFNGNVSFSGPLPELTGKMKGVLSRVTWAGKQIGTIDCALDYDQQRLNITDALVTTDAGDCNITGHIDLAGTPWMSLNISSDDIQLDALSKYLPDIADLKPSGNAKVNCTIQGQYDNPDIQGEVSLTAPAFGSFQMEQGFLKVAGNFKELSITEFNLTKQNSHITLNGRISQNKLDLYFAGSAIPLGTLQLMFGGKAVDGTIDVQGGITGDPLNPVLSGQITGGTLSFGTLSFQQLTAAFIWKSQTIEITSAKLSQARAMISLNGKVSLTKTYPSDLNIEISQFNLADLLNELPTLPPDFDAAGKLSGFVKMTGDFDNPQLQISGELFQGVINTLPVAAEFNLSYYDNRVNIEKFLLTQGTGLLSASGVWETGKLARINMKLYDFPCQALHSFINSDYQLTGTANASISAEWSIRGVSGDYQLAVKDLTVNDYLLGDLNVNGALNNQGISVEEGGLTRKGGLITGQGYIPWPKEFLQGLKLPFVTDDQSRDLNMAVSIKNIPADFVNLFSSESDFKVLKGLLNGELKVNGLVTEPKVSGNLDIDDLMLDISGLPCQIDGFQASVSLDGASATIKRGRGNYGQGKFSVNGSVDYHGLEIKSLNLELTGSDIYYNNSHFNGYGNLNLKLSGPLTGPVISGDIVIFNSKFSLLSYSPTTESSSAWNPTLMIGIRTRGNVRYRQPGLADVTLRGKVQVEGNFDEPKIEGEVETQEGIITLYSRTFKVNHGKVTFDFADGYLPYIDINSSLRSSKAEIFLDVKGRVGNNITVNLTSEPYMSQSDLLAELNWPQFDDNKTPMAMNDVITGNIGVLTDTIFGDFLYQLRSAFDLDYLYLEPNYQQNDLRLYVGRNITKDLFLSYSRSFMDTSKDVWELDYQITPRLSLGSNFTTLDETSWLLMYRFNF
jgi:Uncharacterized protein conserved in bacteria